MQAQAVLSPSIRLCATQRTPPPIFNTCHSCIAAFSIKNSPLCYLDPMHSSQTSQRPVPAKLNHTCARTLEKKNLETTATTVYDDDMAKHASTQEIMEKTKVHIFLSLCQLQFCGLFLRKLNIFQRNQHFVHYLWKSVFWPVPLRLFQRRIRPLHLTIV